RVPVRAAARVPLPPYATSAYDLISFCKISSTRELHPGSSHFRVPIELRGRNRAMDKAAMIDSGATALFLDKPIVLANRITTFPLCSPISLLNIDGSPNHGGSITHFARLHLKVDAFKEWTDFLVANLGGEDVILGLPWLRNANPNIDWKKGSLSVPRQPTT